MTREQLEHIVRVATANADTDEIESCVTCVWKD
jgi:hypothetical protein